MKQALRKCSCSCLYARVSQNCPSFQSCLEQCWGLLDGSKSSGLQAGPAEVLRILCGVISGATGGDKLDAV